MMNTKLKTGALVLLVTIFVIGGLTVLSKRRPQVRGFSTVAFSNLEIQWFRISSDGGWLLITALSESTNTAVSFTYRVEDGRKDELPSVQNTPPVHFTVSDDGKLLTLYLADGTLAYFDYESEGNSWRLSSRLVSKPHPMKKIWYNFSPPTHYGLEIKRGARPSFFPDVQDLDPNQKAVYAEQVVEQAPITLISTSPFESWLWIADTDGRNLRQLAPVEYAELRGGYKSFAWTPDGKKLFYEVPANDTEDKAIWVFEVSKETNSPVVDNAYFPAISPDGGRLAYRKPPHQETIEIMDLGTKELTAKTPGRYTVNWSPGGQYLAILDGKSKHPPLVRFFRSFPFVLESPEQNYFIKIVNRDGKTVTVLPIPIYEERLPDWGHVDRWGKQNIQWSKDGKRVFFLYELDKIGFATITDE